VKHLSPTLLKRHEYTRSTWDVTVPAGIPFERLFDPPFWAHHAGSIKRGDVVFVIAADLSYCMTLIAMDAAVGFVVMKMFPFHDEARAIATAETEAANAEAAKRPAPKEYPCIDFKTATGWRVLAFDGKTVVQNLATEAEAKRELESYIARAGKAAA
jgi:hypothetical protein